MADLNITNPVQTAVTAGRAANANLLEKLNIDGTLYQIHDPELETVITTIDTTVSTLATAINGKQDTLTFDTEPTTGNTYHVIGSDALKTLLDAKATYTDLKTVAFTGSFNDLTDTPAAPDLSSYVSYTYADATYRTIADSFSKAEINSMVAGIDQFKYEAVEALPANPGAEHMFCVYLVPNQGSGQNVKDEYLLMYDGTSYNWELIGTTEVDLTDYIDQETLSAQSYVTSTSLETTLDGYATLTYVQTYVDAKQDTLTFDDAPTANSTNVISSGVAYTYLNQKADKTEINELATAAVKTINGVAPTSGNLELTYYSYDNIVKFVSASQDQTSGAFTLNLTTTTTIIAVNGVNSIAHA